MSSKKQAAKILTCKLCSRIVLLPVLWRSYGVSKNRNVLSNYSVISYQCKCWQTRWKAFFDQYSLLKDSGVARILKKNLAEKPYAAILIFFWAQTPSNFDHFSLGGANLSPTHPLPLATRLLKVLCNLLSLFVLKRSIWTKTVSKPNQNTQEKWQNACR